MKILIVGAGAVGGYFGGRLMEKGEEVTFLVREGRREQLIKNGLVIESIHGNASLSAKTIVAGEEAEAFDIVLLSTKAYHLQGAIRSIRPFIGTETLIIPLLNGISHMDTLRHAFGKERVAGGLCFIESTLNNSGNIIQTSPIHDLVFGELTGEKTQRIEKAAAAFSGTKANFRLSDNIKQEMWHKYLFITAMSGITTLMRSSIGPIRELESSRITLHLLIKEITSIMSFLGAPVAEDVEHTQIKKMDELSHSMKSSMLRDMEKSLLIEADHLQGYLLIKAKEGGLHVPILESVYGNLKVYEQQYLK